VSVPKIEALLKIGWVNKAPDASADCFKNKRLDFISKFVLKYNQFPR
jgi:hypothetical protein